MINIIFYFFTIILTLSLTGCLTSQRQHNFRACISTDKYIRTLNELDRLNTEISKLENTVRFNKLGLVISCENYPNHEKEIEKNVEVFAAKVIKECQEKYKVFTSQKCEVFKDYMGAQKQLGKPIALDVKNSFLKHDPKTVEKRFSEYNTWLTSFSSKDASSKLRIETKDILILTNLDRSFIFDEFLYYQKYIDQGKTQEEKEKREILCSIAHKVISKSDIISFVQDIVQLSLLPLSNINVSSEIKILLQIKLSEKNYFEKFIEIHNNTFNMQELREILAFCSSEPWQKLVKGILKEIVTFVVADALKDKTKLDSLIENGFGHELFFRYLNFSEICLLNNFAISPVGKKILEQKDIQDCMKEIVSQFFVDLGEVATKFIHDQIENQSRKENITSTVYQLKEQK